MIKVVYGITSMGPYCYVVRLGKRKKLIDITECERKAYHRSKWDNIIEYKLAQAKKELAIQDDLEDRIQDK